MEAAAAAGVGAVTVAGMAPQVKAQETKAVLKDVKRKLARYVVSAKYEDLPAAELGRLRHRRLAA